ncbi:2'-5' RNA ligase family protein [Mesorhizobium sp. M0340]|uniref:2'-5' RNA ligase family protein n=1 Tax=Mesorhizobium sp. M0340 TaxID=2956939 RepID=UPI00333B237E
MFPHYRQRGADFEFLLGRASSTAEIAGVGAESIQRPLRFHLTSSLFVLNFSVGYDFAGREINYEWATCIRNREQRPDLFRWEGSKRRFDDRTFFAILAESAVAGPLARKAIALSRELGLQGWFVPENHIHISLVGLGDHDRYPEKLVEIARHIGSMSVAKPFDVSFDRLTAFGGGSLVLRNGDSNPALQEFWRNLTALISDSPLKLFLTKSIEPHVTLLRDEVRVPRIRERSIDPIGWTVRDFVLIHSVIGKGIYRESARWQLNGQDDALAGM